VRHQDEPDQTPRRHHRNQRLIQSRRNSGSWVGVRRQRSSRSRSSIPTLSLFVTGVSFLPLDTRHQDHEDLLGERYKGQGVTSTHLDRSHIVPFTTPDPYHPENIIHPKTTTIQSEQLPSMPEKTTTILGSHQSFMRPEKSMDDLSPRLSKGTQIRQHQADKSI
jgi:hypothetical protein